MAGFSDYKKTYSVHYDTCTKIKIYPGRYGVKPVRDAESLFERFELNCVINVCGSRYLLHIYFGNNLTEKVMDIAVTESPATRLFRYKRNYTEKITKDDMEDVIDDLIKNFFNPTHGKILAVFKSYYTKNPENAVYHDIFLPWFLTTAEPGVRSKTFIVSLN